MFDAQWIKPAQDMGDVCPVFRKSFDTVKPVKNAQMHITAMGVYEAALNGKPIGDFFMAPGWSSYHKRHLYQTYDVTALLERGNTLEVTVGKGWYRGRLGHRGAKELWGKEAGLIARLELFYEDGSSEVILTDASWETAESAVRFSEIYDGELYDARIIPEVWQNALVFDAPRNHIVPFDGEPVREFERIKPVAFFTTPEGERVLDFGQLLTGRLCFSVEGKAGDVIEVSHAEVLDRDGGFYTENLRSAKQKLTYICADGKQEYKPHFTFMGFRYIRLDRFPMDVKPEDFTAIAAYSGMRRTGRFNSSNSMLNKLFENILWSQRGNFLDVPTDCPQRDERLGWTGDAQMFVHAAAYNYNVERFFTKWLRDLRAEQHPDGLVPHVVPDMLREDWCSSAWGDVAVIMPWRLYLMYGSKALLREQYDSMRRWVEYIRGTGNNEFLWNTGRHFGDWLALDAPEGERKGASDESLIATAFYAHSTNLLTKVSKVLGFDHTPYEALYNGIVRAFRERFPAYKTQTEYVLALHFGLCEDKTAAAAELAGLIERNGGAMTTGFVGTPYLLHALSENGYSDIAYNLLLREAYPSWLYPVTKGATTVWEHWDSIKEDGTFWPAGMNSFNHYAYGAVADWLYTAAAGICTDEQHPAFERVIFTPLADRRLEHLSASLETRYGRVSSAWSWEGGRVRYMFEVPTAATAVIGDKRFELGRGRHELTV